MPVQRFNSVYKPLLFEKATIKDLPGGRGRGGSHFISSHILYKLTQDDYYRAVIMREVHGDIRESIWREIMDRIEEQEFNREEFDISESSMRITHIATGNYVYAKGFRKSKGSSTAKLKSLAGCTHVYIDECEEIEEPDFNQLAESLRTIKGEIEVYRVFNPPHKNHWIVKRYYNLMPISGELKETLLSRGIREKEFESYYRLVPKEIKGFLSVVSTYHDNRKNLNQDYIDKLESYGDPNSTFYNLERFLAVTNGLSADGKKGRIYKNWKPTTYEEFKNLPVSSSYGLDFGYSGDPLAVVEVKEYRKQVYIHEVLYETGLTTPDIDARLKAKGVKRNSPIYADSADPKSIAELKKLGWKVIPAIKGPDSVNPGIRHICSLTVHYTDCSKNLIMENEEYSWHLDSDKEPTDTPEDKNNHLMDAFRYNQYRKEATVKVQHITGNENRRPVASRILPHKKAGY